MSLPATIFKCSVCDFSWVDAMAWGNREYVLANGLRLRAPWQLGWCHACKGIAAVESLSAEHQLAEIQKIEQELALYLPPSILPWWRFDRFIFREGTLILEEERKHRHRSLTIALDDARDLLKLQEQRSNPPRCMECGSTNFTAPFITNEKPWEDRSHPKFTGFHHPNCGGEIFMIEDGLRIAVAPSVRRYTAEGNFIEKIRIEGYSTPREEFFTERDASNMKARSK